ncbi:hypothetical protein H4R34_000477 [Dimargaris verticillata]|uniref:Sequence orphan n=1 Tax=Dimargaris verticillata TaxID=2761393 RepID=A0A9W8EBU3_9FUNG|nr:hypothetical protein H4R34_000477 [Dimargaris verticillata]
MRLFVSHPLRAWLVVVATLLAHTAIASVCQDCMDARCLQKKPVDCSANATQLSAASEVFAEGSKITLNKPSLGKRDEGFPHEPAPDDPKISIRFHCSAEHANQQCDNVQKSLTKAIGYLEDILALKESLAIDVKYFSYCSTYKKCNVDDVSAYGHAYPARSAVVVDQEGHLRLYPQPLIKQLDMYNPPSFANVDILAAFNSDIDYWFESEGTDIQPNQTDFELAVCREILHGLGLISQWDMYFGDKGTVLTPNPFSLDVDLTMPNKPFSVNSFLESAFDQYLVEKSNGKPLYFHAERMNQFLHGNSTGSSGAGNRVEFQSQMDFKKKFMASDVQPIARHVMDLATTPRSIVFVPHNEIIGLNETTASDSADPFYVETTIIPFRSEESLSHLDSDVFKDTANFVYQIEIRQGVSLTSLIARYTNDTNNPYGPAILTILNTMGYAVKGKLPRDINVTLANLSIPSGQRGVDPLNGSPQHTAPLWSSLLSVAIVVMMTSAQS